MTDTDKTIEQRKAELDAARDAYHDAYIAAADLEAYIKALRALKAQKKTDD